MEIMSLEKDQWISSFQAPVPGGSLPQHGLNWITLIPLNRSSWASGSQAQARKAKYDCHNPLKLGCLCGTFGMQNHLCRAGGNYSGWKGSVPIFYRNSLHLQLLKSDHVYHLEHGLVTSLSEVFFMSLCCQQKSLCFPFSNPSTSPSV